MLCLAGVASSISPDPSPFSISLTGGATTRCNVDLNTLFDHLDSRSPTLTTMVPGMGVAEW